jgi:hypothetical protein
MKGSSKMGKSFNSKQELIDFIKAQCKVELKNIDNFCGNNPDFLYAEIPQKYKNSVLSLCNKYGIEINEHLNNKYWFYIAN